MSERTMKNTKSSFFDEAEHCNPWKLLTSDGIYENEWIILKEDRVINPEGRSSSYARICFKKRTVGIIALDENDDLWLVGQYRYPINQYSWEIPGGGATDREDVLEAAKRELKEETGITAERWQLILRMYTCNSITDEEVFVYFASQLSHGSTELDETELITIKKISFQHALEMLNDGFITDAVSIAGLLKLKEYLSDE
jgi:8-oxo-dGTP pyrophosphatase MutT (NUDIX family)